MRPGAYPLSEQIMYDLLIPPIAAFVWKLMAGGWGSVVQGGKLSERTRGRQWFEFWVVLALGYALLFGFTIYAVLT